MSQVTSSHHAVVHATTATSDCGNTQSVTSRTSAKPTAAAIIALTSDHALTRHQYQRSISTRPMPAPDSSTNSHAWRMLSR